MIKKIVIILIGCILGRWSMIPLTSASCLACASGAPLIESYVSWMGSILAVVDRAPVNTTVSLQWQQYNTITAKWYTNQRNDLLNTMPQQSRSSARGIQSDIDKLNNITETLDNVAIRLINWRFQWKENLPPELISELRVIFQRQVWQDSLFVSGDWVVPTTYEWLLMALLQLHSTTIRLTQWWQLMSWFTWQWYVSNTALLSQTSEYYSCGRWALNCNESASLVQNTTQDIKIQRAVIAKAWNDAAAVFRPSYWSTNTIRIKAKERFVTAFGPISLRKREWTQATSSNEWSSIREELQQLKLEQVATITQAQSLIRDGARVTIEPTLSRPYTNINTPDYERRTIELLAVSLNRATDTNLQWHANAQLYALDQDSRPVTYTIPDMTTEIYRIATTSVAQSANSLYNACVAHCSNIPNGICGRPIS